jgi:hypothetical protein
MKSRAFLVSISSLLFFLAGALLQMAISAALLWGELEVRLLISPSGNSALTLRCPHILSFGETGMIRATIRNPLDQDIQPSVTAEISRNGNTQQMSDLVVLAAHETKTVEWEVDASNLIFGRLILVSVLQGKSNNLPAHQSYCGILVLNLLGMKGQAIVVLLCVTSFALLTLGALLWLRTRLPLNERDEHIARAFGSLAVLTTLGLFTALLRWWGLIIILDALALLVIVVIFTDVLFGSGQRRS